jgi:hypothetical protein
MSILNSKAAAKVLLLRHHNPFLKLQNAQPMCFLPKLKVRKFNYAPTSSVGGYNFHRY